MSLPTSSTATRTHRVCAKRLSSFTNSTGVCKIKTHKSTRLPWTTYPKMMSYPLENFSSNQWRSSCFRWCQCVSTCIQHRFPCKTDLICIAGTFYKYTFWGGPTYTIESKLQRMGPRNVHFPKLPTWVWPLTFRYSQISLIFCYRHLCSNFTHSSYGHILFPPSPYILEQVFVC